MTFSHSLLKSSSIFQAWCNRVLHFSFARKTNLIGQYFKTQLLLIFNRNVLYDIVQLILSLKLLCTLLFACLLVCIGRVSTRRSHRLTTGINSLLSPSVPRKEPWVLSFSCSAISSALLWFSIGKHVLPFL